MGTRSTVKFYDGNEIILSVYQQYDGYIEGVGHELAEWLKTKKIINGIGDETREAGYANGMGCLAAQYVADHKTEIGGFYLTNSQDEQEYNYEVRYKAGVFEITVGDFKGTPEALLAFKPEEV